jgi:hypothetical protein
MLKGALCAAPILAYPKPGEKFIVDTDVSNVEIGRVLSQVQDGHERVIAYYSKTLNKAERNYCVTTCHSESTGTFSEIPIWIRVPPAYEPLCVDLAHEF